MANLLQPWLFLQSNLAFSLKQTITILDKNLTSANFFFLFYKKIIKIVYAIFAVAIKNLKVQFSNSNLLVGKNTIWFKFLAQKKEIDKRTADALYNKNQKFILQKYMLIMEKYELKPFFHINIGLFQLLENKLSSRQLRRKR